MTGMIDTAPLLSDPGYLAAGLFEVEVMENAATEYKIKLII
jgi:hypothetical protein